MRGADGVKVADATTNENAVFIRDAGNAHDELVAALRDIVQYVSPGDDVPLRAMLDEARAALAKVQSDGGGK